jgi:hypothetical protein
VGVAVRVGVGVGGVSVGVLVGPRVRVGVAQRAVAVQLAFYRLVGEGWHMLARLGEHSGDSSVSRSSASRGAFRSCSFLTCRSRWRSLPERSRAW